MTGDAPLRVESHTPYGPAIQLLRLALRMTEQGVTITETEDLFGVTRATAERMHRAIREVFGDQHVDTSRRDEAGQILRRLDIRRARDLATIRPAQLVELDHAAAAAARAGLPDRAEALRALRDELMNCLPAKPRLRLDTDLSAMLEAEVEAHRPGPRPVIADGLLDRLRDAILKCRTIRTRYDNPRNRLGDELVLEPHGLLFGARHYLIAFKHGEPESKPRSFALARLRHVRLGRASFTRRAGFSLDAFTAPLFGVFHEPPIDVVWRFAKSRRAEVEAFRFHPSQSPPAILPDGRVEVRFKAGGLHEMAQHLFTWGADVEVVAPRALRDLYAAKLRRALRAMEGTDAAAV